MKVETVSLEGRVVRLEPLSLDHLDGLCLVGLDEDLWRLTVSQVHTRDDLQRYIQTALTERAHGVSLPFATLERATGQPIGSTRFGNIDRQHRRVEIGWTWLGRTWQRTPANTEAKFLMLQYAFEELGCIRVEFKTDVLNERSRRALLRIGAQQEGILRQHMITEGDRLRDTVYFSILDREWPTVRAGLEAKLAR